MVLPLALEERVVSVNFTKQNITDTSYFLIIDLNNASGEYKHSSGAGIHISGAIGGASKTVAADVWFVQLGIVTATTVSNTTLAWVTIGTVSLRSSDVLIAERSLIASPLALDLTVDNGELSAVATNNIETVGNLTSSTNIEDISGASRPAEVGDLVARVTKISGEGSLSADITLWYWVE